MDKVYIVKQCEEYGENDIIVGVFRDKEKAEKYAEYQKQLYPYEICYTMEHEIMDDKFDINSKVGNYYNYSIPLDMIEVYSNLDEYNDYCTETEPLPYTYDNYVEITEEVLDAYSVESYEKAKEIALNEYARYTGEKFKEMNYEVLNKITNQTILSSPSYLPYETKVCPICGGRIKHPYTGLVTTEQMEEDANTCQLIEIVDEYDNTLGYSAVCRKT